MRDRQAPKACVFLHDFNASYKEISMNIELSQDGVCLKKNQVVKVHSGLGYSIACERGSVWVTQDGDPRDVILHAGETFTLDREGPALLQAFEPGAINIGRPDPQNGAARLAALLKSALAGAGIARRATGI
jgi:hypothetical protein